MSDAKNKIGPELELTSVQETLGTAKPSQAELTHWRQCYPALLDLKVAFEKNRTLKK